MLLVIVPSVALFVTWESLCCVSYAYCYYTECYEARCRGAHVEHLIMSHYDVRLKLPSLMLRTRPKQLLVSPPLGIALPGVC
jgi:hypothetical protein